MTPGRWAANNPRVTIAPISGQTFPYLTALRSTDRHASERARPAPEAWKFIMQF
jgi:hypothetical protein